MLGLGLNIIGLVSGLGRVRVKTGVRNGVRNGARNRVRNGVKTEVGDCFCNGLRGPYPLFWANWLGCKT